MINSCETTPSKKENKLISEGWKKQFSCSDLRLLESVELFKTMGRDVLIEDVETENLPGSDSCKNCFISCNSEVKTIWTKAKLIKIDEN